jgi:hypothetical protein
VSPGRPPADAAGFDLRPDPLQARTPGDFVEALRRYRAWAGDPSYRQMASRAGGTTAASTIWLALRSEDVPRLELVLAIIAGCGGGEDDQRRFATAWRTLRLAAGAHAAP